MSLFGLKGMAIAGALSAAVGFGSGVWVRDAFCDAASAKLQVEQQNHIIASLRGRIEAVNKLNEAHGKRAAADAARLAELEKQVNETPSNAGACLDRDAAGRVRSVR